MLLRIKFIKDNLRGGKNQKQLERIVDEVLIEFNGLYNKNWEKIMERRKANKIRVFLIFRWSTFSLRPIIIAEIIKTLLAVSDNFGNILENKLPDEIDECFVKSEILDLYYSLVEMRATALTGDVSLRTLHLTHFTVRKYLFQHDPISGAKLQINKNVQSVNSSLQNNILAEVCLRYLRIPFIWKEAGAISKNNQMLGSFREYAGYFWYQHIKSDAPHYDILLRLMKLFFC